MTGTWEGFITDPSDLFADGGPWPIHIAIYSKEGYVIGQVGAIKFAKDRNDIKPLPFWAQCKDGVLTDIFWGNKASCGAFSQEGLQVSKNALVLKLHWENAMANADFLTFLERKSHTYPYPLPESIEAFSIDEIKSCH